MKTIEDPGHRQERARRGSFKLQEGRMKMGASQRTVDDSTPLPLGQSLSLAPSSLYVFRERCLSTEQKKIRENRIIITTSVPTETSPRIRLSKR